MYVYIYALYMYIVRIQISKHRNYSPGRPPTHVYKTPPAIRNTLCRARVGIWKTSGNKVQRIRATVCSRSSSFFSPFSFLQGFFSFNATGIWITDLCAAARGLCAGTLYLAIMWDINERGRIKTITIAIPRPIPSLVGRPKNA